MIPWLEPDTPFPDPSQALAPPHEAAGLLAIGADLSPARLLQAYAQGIFPWFGPGQPILWWSTNPRMVLQVSQFRLHSSLGKTLRRFLRTPGCEIRFDHDFAQTIAHCARVPRAGQSGTWILPAMQEAYQELHRLGFAHSVETWRNGRMVGGLYCIGLGHAVFGESMFALESDASKIALAALVAWCRTQRIEYIDCQQQTPHLAFMGAAAMERAPFLQWLDAARQHPCPPWHYDPLYWGTLGLAPEPL
ncbi:MAG: leucyl/phenylalanyl-tRNA--protein transferase [Rhodoferax sp.]